MARLYGLYIRQRGTRKWELIPIPAGPKDRMVRTCQSTLLDYALGVHPGWEAALRPERNTLLRA
jgi:hypothetical protein